MLRRFLPIAMLPVDAVVGVLETFSAFSTESLGDDVLMPDDNEINVS